MVFFFLLCIASSVRRPSLKSRAAQPSPTGGIYGGHREGRAGLSGEAVRATDRNAEQKKRRPERQAAVGHLRRSRERRRIQHERSEPADVPRRPLGKEGASIGVGGGFWGEPTRLYCTLYSGGERRMAGAMPERIGVAGAGRRVRGSRHDKPRSPERTTPRYV